MEIPINYLAVLVSAVAAIVLGFLWFGPVFGKIWMREMGISPDAVNEWKTDPIKKRKMNQSYAIQAVTALIMAYVLAHNVIFGVAYLDITGIAGGLQAGFWNWLGFAVPVSLGAVLWEGKSWKYWLITAGYYLVSLLIMGAILASWTA